MLDPKRHVPLEPIAWNADDARSAIEDIVSDALAHLETG
jgi:hypothetical protein